MKTNQAASQAKKKVVIKKKTTEVKAEPKVIAKVTKESKEDVKSKKVVVPSAKPKEALKAKPEAKKETAPREVKYKYPAECPDSLTRKKFRHETRLKDQNYQKDLKAMAPGTKEYKVKDKEYKAFLAENYQ